MVDQHYEDPKLARLYDLDSGWSIDRDFYASLPKGPRQRILDLGCGTGLLCNAFAASGHQVTGVDPSSSMLEIAFSKPRGGAVDWVKASAQSFRSAKRFDLIVMTGHAFQVLLEPDDVRAALETMRSHLAPEGRIVFESRNPTVDWASRWNYHMQLQLEDGVVVRESRRFIAMREERLSFEFCFELPDETLVTPSTIRFWSRHAIEGFLEQAGLAVDGLLGGWSGERFDARSSEEMIFSITKASDD